MRARSGSRPIYASEARTITAARPKMKIRTRVSDGEFDSEVLQRQPCRLRQLRSAGDTPAFTAIINFVLATICCLLIKAGSIRLLNRSSERREK